MVNAEIYKVAYAVIPKNREYDKRYYTYCFSVWRLADKKTHENIDLKGFELLSVSYSNDSLRINNNVYHQRDFYSKIKQLIENHDNYMVEFSVDEEMIFEDYMFVLSELKRAVNAIRNDYSIKNYSVEFETLSDKNAEDANIIQQKIPLRVVEK